MSWPQPTISGYNATPPADDGSQTASNVVAWATILNKIGNPLKTLLETTIGSIASYLTPTGAIMAFAGSAAPTGWLLCFGQAVSRSTFADLFAVIGTTYGAGDGATTFNVPDLRGRVVAGKDDMGGTAAGRLTFGVGTALGGTIGNEQLAAHTHTGTVSISDPGHNHSQAAHSHGVTDPGHAHSYNLEGSVPTGNDVIPPGGSTGSPAGGPGTTISSVTGIGVQAAAATNIAAATGITATTTIASSGSGNAGNVQPTMIGNWLIKT